VIAAGALHPTIADYLCRCLGALARRLGCDVPAWQNGYVLDYHALDAPVEPDRDEEE
jgi:hypothetical protein